MKHNNILKLGLLLFTTVVWAQETEEPTGRLELAINYGIGGNFFVTDYDEQQTSQYYSKNFLGTIGGFDLIWNLKDNKQAFGLSFDKSVNRGEKNVTRTTANNSIRVENFNLSHINKMYGIFYKRKFKSTFSASLGFYLYRDIGQYLEVYENFSYLRETKSTEGGFFLAADYFFFKSGNFEVGIQSKLFSYFAISEFDLEAISLTPKIRYRF